LARALHDKEKGNYTIKENQQTEMKPNLANVNVIKEVLKVSRSTTEIGLDHIISSAHSWEIEQMIATRN